ncbi:hypothetical protein GC176_14125 [bacterium]|nr:hypothetical protein [bacterium]
MLLPLLRAVVAIASLCLIAATRNLWFGDSGFPLIPFLDGLTDVPLWIDNVLSTLLVASLLLLTCVSIRNRFRYRSLKTAADSRCSVVRFACSLMILCGVSLALLNQHRLQPWLYHLMLLCPILTLDERQSVSQSQQLVLRSPAGLIIFLTASIYFWSGISKCDRAFIEGHGQTFVSAIANVLGLSLKFWSPAMRSASAAVLPIGELLVAVCLFIPKARRLALFASLLMHGLLITAVGPWGMDQRPGVLLWNVLFITQNVLLLRHQIGQSRRSDADRSCATDSASATVETGAGSASGTPSGSSAEPVLLSRSLQFARGVVIVAAVTPALRFAGWFDNWPSWAVYTAGNEHAYVLIDEDAIDCLPPDIRHFVQPRAMNDGWSWLRIDLWSIATVDAPLYPQKRFAVACGLAVAQLPGLQDSVRILTESSANPLTGERTAQSFVGQTGLQQLANQFTLNLKSRSVSMRPERERTPLSSER